MALQQIAQEVDRPDPRKKNECQGARETEIDRINANCAGDLSGDHRKADPIADYQRRSVLLDGARKTEVSAGQQRRKNHREENTSDDDFRWRAGYLSRPQKRRRYLFDL